MSKRSRVYAVVGIAAAVAIGTVAAVVVVSGGDGRAASSPAKTLKGRPPLELDLGVRDDAEATALRRAATMYAHGNPADAARIFERYDSVEADVGTALASWPDGTIETLGRLAAAHPRELVRPAPSRLRALLGRPATAGGGCVESGEARPQPDTLSAVRADDLLHRSTTAGCRRSSRASRRRRSPPAATAPSSLSSPARRGVHDRIWYGIALQRLGHPLTAERVFARRGRAGARGPGRPDRGRLRPVRQGPPRAGVLASRPADKRFPHASTVRFHLGRPALARRGQGGAEAAPACGEGRAWLQARARGSRLPPETRLDKIGLPLRKIGRSAYGFRPPRVRQCPPQ